MKNLIVHITAAVLICWYRLCRLLFPVRQRIVLISRQQDGTTCDFELIRDNILDRYPAWQIVILAKKLSNPLRYSAHIMRQVFYIATSRAVVLDSYCIPIGLLNKRVKAPVLQMWHALGNMKKFGYMILDTPEGHSSKTARLMHMHEGYDSALISSKSFAADLAAGFNMDPAYLYEAPLPRVDLLTDQEIRKRKRDEILSELPQLDNGKRNIVYCPTWRKEASQRDTDALQELANVVDPTRYNLIFKKHPVDTRKAANAAVLQNYDPRFNMLYIADYVISDYSTVIYEAGLLDIPVFIYAYDWDTYSEKRAMNIDVETEVPAVFSTRADDIARAIESDDFDTVAYREFIRKNISLPDRSSCTQRVVDHIFNLIDDTGDQTTRPNVSY